MSRYQIAVSKLLLESEKLGNPFELCKIEVLDRYVTQHFPSALRNEFLTLGYPVGEFEFTDHEFLTLYAVETLGERQAGYRFNSLTKTILHDWEDSRVVIADLNADPISIDAEGKISFAQHGEGAWNHCMIAENISEFFTLLAAALNFVATNGRIVVDDHVDSHELGHRLSLALRATAGLSASPPSHAKVFLRRLVDPN